MFPPCIEAQFHVRVFVLLMDTSKSCALVGPAGAGEGVEGGRFWSRGRGAAADRLERALGFQLLLASPGALGLLLPRLDAPALADVPGGHDDEPDHHGTREGEDAEDGVGARQDHPAGDESEVEGLADEGLDHDVFSWKGWIRSPHCARDAHGGPHISAGR